jgi:2-methylcitrate dehydratase PrpD
MKTMQRRPITENLANFISRFEPYKLPAEIIEYTKLLIFDGVGTLAAASHPKVTSGALVGAFAESQGGPSQASLIGRGTKVGVVNAVLANGTLGYACDFEPHHPEAILHPIAVMIPTALAISEFHERRGIDFVAAVALGCEIAYRVSMAMDPKQLYSLGFHPSAVCGGFGAAAASAYLMDLDTEQTLRALGLAALQASGLMAWEDDPKEDARAFQMGMAARNGVTAALLADNGFGAPDRVFDGGHNVLNAFSRGPSSAPLLDGLGNDWDGVMKLAIKPYPCVSFLHPALDALEILIRENDLESRDVTAIELRFADSGSHCIDDNPLKGHCAQYVLPVRTARGKLDFLDLFEDRRESDPEVARLAAATRVIRDHEKLEKLFPKFYVGEVTLSLRDGRRLVQRAELARGYPEAPMAAGEVRQKFESIVGTVADAARCKALAESSLAIAEANNVHTLARLLSVPATTD